MAKSKILDNQVVTPRKRVTLDCGHDGRTNQSDRETTNIRNIVANFTATGSTSYVNRNAPQFGDFYNADDLHTVLTRAQRARSEFMDLPAAVRAAAKNDPVEYLEMLATDEGFEQLEAAGLPLDPSPSKPSEEKTPESQEPAPPAPDPEKAIST